MANSGKTRTIDEMDDIFEMVEVMKALGIAATGLKTLDEMKSRVKAELNQAEITPSWSAGQAFSILSEAKEKDDRKREVLLKFYTDANRFLDELDEKMLSLLQEHSGNVKENMKQHMKQLSQKEYYLLVAGETSSGKSSLVNLILGEEVLPSFHLSTTSTICEVKFGEERRLVVHFKDKDPETGLLTKTILLEQSAGSCEQSYLDQISPYVHLKNDREKGANIKKIELFWPHSLLQKGIVIVDSPGIGESDEMDEMVIQYLPEAFAFIYVINSGNAGGVQKDRLEKLLQKTKEVSLGIQKEQREGNKTPRGLLERLLSKCALFVCNKWDQVPKQEIQNIKNDVTKKLQRTWPGFDPESQITYMSVTRANTAQNFGIITENFSSLMNAMRIMVLKSIDARLELQWGWLDNILLRIIFQAKAFVRNASRDRDTVNQKMTLIVDRLGLIEEQKNEVIAQLYRCFNKHVDDAVLQLSEYLSSEQVIARFTLWTLDEVPKPGLLEKAFSSRFLEVIAQWEEENKVLANTRVFLMQQFQKYCGDVEGQLQNLRTAATEDPSSIAAFFAIIREIVRALFLFPPTPYFSRLARIQLKFMLNEVPPVNRHAVMAILSRSYLDTVVNTWHLKKLVQDQLKDLKLLLEQIEARLPELIQADKLLYKQLEADKRTQKEIEQLYKPMWEEGCQHRGRLAVFGLTEVCPDEICLEEIDWKEDMSSCLGVGSFGAVYQGMRTRHGEVQIVALKVCKEELDVNNASKMVDEVKVLRALDHPHIVQFYGVSLLKGVETVRLILVMEKCEENLKNRIFKDPESVPGKSEDPVVVRKVCQWAKEISDGLAYIHEQGVVHRDLKLENILLSQENSVRIADVGQAKPEVGITGTVAGTYVYMAPEVFNSLEYGSKADMYSLGIVLWEMWYGQHAFADSLGTLRDFLNLVDQGNRPIHRKGCKVPPFHWEQLMKQCWDENPENRPTASNCKQAITMLQIELDKNVCAISHEEIQWEENMSSCLGDGAFGVVYQGTMTRQGQVQSVALKVYSEGLDVSKASEIMQEMTRLRTLQHPHIVQFYGISLLGKEETVKMILVIEKCKGNLCSFILEHPESVPGQAGNSAAVKVVSQWLEEITDGLAYIHELGIVHRNLKLENLLLSEENTVKIADIGLAKLAKDIKRSFARPSVYTCHMAPEVLRSQKYDSKADMYSLGIIMWEIWYGQRAFVPGGTQQDLINLVGNGYRPEDKEGYRRPDDHWKDLMVQCWDENPEHRPTAKECNNSIAKMLLST